MLFVLVVVNVVMVVMVVMVMVVVVVALLLMMMNLHGSIDARCCDNGNCWPPRSEPPPL